MDQDKTDTERLPLVKGGQVRSDAEIERSLLIWLSLFIVAAVAISIWLGVKIADYFF